MRLDSVGISSLRENLKKFVVREEIETRECRTFCFEIFLEAFLNIIKLFVVIKELAQINAVLIICLFESFGLLFGTIHMLFPLFVDLLEKFAFSRQLFNNIIRTENILKIHPLSLELKPFVNNVG